MQDDTGVQYEDENGCRRVWGFPGVLAKLYTWLYHPQLKHCSLPLHLSWCVVSILVQNCCHSSPRWVLHIGGG